MLYQCLCDTAATISSQCLAMLPDLPTWQEALPERRQAWLGMLGLDPLPPRSDLAAVITGTVSERQFEIRKLHFQPVPECRVSTNLYVPLDRPGPFPVVIYVCGHAESAKVWYQEFGRWFAKHGYAVFVLDAIQIGENHGIHHGTHRYNLWHWYSQGYSPAAMEVWTAMRAIDYLETLPEIDASRVGITGNSGGGTISWFTGAADPRLKVVLPSCQTGNVFQHIYDRTVDGHCDCSFWVNHLGWDFPDLAALIAPRALLISASTEDILFRPYAFRDLFQRARHVYRLYDQEDHIHLHEAVNKHGQTSKCRLAQFSWFEKHLKGNDCPVTDDFDGEKLPAETLAVYGPGEQAPPSDRLAAVHDFFIPLPQGPVPAEKQPFLAYQTESLSKLRALTFNNLLKSLRSYPSWKFRSQGQTDDFQYRTFEFCSEPEMPVRLQVALPRQFSAVRKMLLGPLSAASKTSFVLRGSDLDDANLQHLRGCVEVRGTGATSVGNGLLWTCRRSYPLVGQTLYERQTLDLLQAGRVAREAIPGLAELYYFGSGNAAALAIYAALLDPDCQGVVLKQPLTTHWQGGPEFLNVLKIGDLPQNAALLLPKSIAFIGEIPAEYQFLSTLAEKLGCAKQVSAVADFADWCPTDV